MALPNIGMNFTPYDTLTAAELDNLVENIEALADGTGLNDAVITQDKLATGADFATGWNVNALPAVTAVTNNGNRSYTLTHASSIASVVSPGMRRRFTRTSAAPITSFSLNGTNMYLNKTSPAGMTFTDDFVVSAWVKLTSYAVAGSGIISRRDGTQGWQFNIESTGQVQLVGFNGALGNYSLVRSYQSIPLNKWVHIAAQLDMNTFTATTTTSYIMLDGKDVPASVIRAGTSPTALVQAGNLEIGSVQGGTAPFAGKIAQVAIYSAKVTQATILASIDRGLTGSETSLISAYSGANTTDLASTGNNLTAQNAAVSGYADAPFGNGGISSTLEYGLTMSVSSDGLTEVVQCPEGCALPTTGGITASAYSSMANPYGWVSDKGRWYIKSITKTTIGAAFGGINQWTGSNFTLNSVVGKFILGYQINFQLNSTVGGVRNGEVSLTSTSYPVVNGAFNDLASISYAAVGTDLIIAYTKEQPRTFTASETITATAQIQSATGSEAWNVRGDLGEASIYLIPSCL